MNSDKNFKDMIDFIDTTAKTNKVKKKKMSKTMLVLINLLSISLLIGGGIGIKILYDRAKDYNNIEQMEKDLANLYEEPTVEEPTDPDSDLVTPDENQSVDNYENKSFDELLAINQDTVAWLKVKNTNINMPIVKASNNSYYLTHNFKKENSSIGWLFADYRNEFSNGLSRNTIIYGHTFRNGSPLMMGTLKYVLKDSWLKDESNYTITFNTKAKNMKWQIFSIYTTPVTDDYLRVNFNSDDDFLQFTKALKAKSIKKFNAEIKDNDYILTLSTCYGNSENRLVVHAKLIRN